MKQHIFTFKLEKIEANCQNLLSCLYHSNTNTWLILCKWALTCTRESQVLNLQPRKIRTDTNLTYHSRVHTNFEMVNFKIKIWQTGHEHRFIWRTNSAMCISLTHTSTIILILLLLYSPHSTQTQIQIAFQI